MHDLGDAGAHARPVVHGDRHVVVDEAHGVDQAGAGFRIVDAGQVNVDEAFALHPEPQGCRGLADEAHERPARIPLHRQDRVRHEQRLVALVDDLGERRIEQEGHVVVDDLEHRHVLAPALALDLEIEEADIGAVRGAARLEVLEGFRCEIRQRLRRIGGEVLGRHAPEQIAQEGWRNGFVPGFQHGDGFCRQLASAGRCIQLHARILLCLVAGALPQSVGLRNRSLPFRAG